MAMSEKVWKLVYPGMPGLDDRVINPLTYLERARKAARAAVYGEVMKRCGKEGLKVDVLWSEGMDHVFHLIDPDCEEAKQMMKKVVAFIKLTE
uniref:Alpha/beta hydrolase fold-3 domain-containing protein n=1 Tax=Kalanchoe fedtschenkoi TaxID=63787 RepID=A0A7N0ZR71_KALFE